MSHRRIPSVRSFCLLACCLGLGYVPSLCANAQVADPQMAPTTAAAATISELPDAPEPVQSVPVVMLAASEPQVVAAPQPYLSSSYQFLPVPAAGFNSFRRAVDPEDCPHEKGNDPRCHVHWGQLAISGSFYLAFQNVGNLYTGYDYRLQTLNGKWWDRYVNSVEGWRWRVWNDQNPFIDDYVGHPLQGAITNSIWIQNDPKGMTVTQANDWVYYLSRLRALAFSTFFSFEWKLGPVGEASIGHNGDHYFYEKGVTTNETGWVELVTTPVGGILWTAGEDYLDRTLIPKLEGHTHNALALMGISLLTPARTTANVFRFRAPWYRDDRIVKANSFFGDPADDVESSPDAKLAGNHEGDRIAPAPTASTATNTVGITTSAASHAPFAKNVPYIGGVHEFGVIWGLSLFSSGPAGEIKYMPIVVRYSYLLHLAPKFALRYSPELTALAMISWPTPTTFSPDNQLPEEQRSRAYGSGISPLGLQMDFLPAHRVQPFLSTNAGGVYYQKPVMGPNPNMNYASLPVTGARLLGTADFGAGVNIFRKRRQAFTLGYRHQYLAGTFRGSSSQANTFYVGVSRFRTREGADDRPPVF